MKNFSQHIKSIVLLLALFVGVQEKVFSTHLVGGDLTIKYIGTLNGNERYEIIFDIYRDCYNSTTQFDNSIDVAIYKNETNDKSQYSIETLGPASEFAVDPPDGGSACGFKPNVCIKRGIYSKIISLPPSSVGYHVMWIRCCRNTQINIASDEGQSYYSFIPPTKFKNSSPSFNSVPSPYICASDTLTLLNSATDPDGDSLVYSLVSPYNGGDKTNPIPTMPSNFSLPKNAKYNIGFSAKTPFGLGGYADINSKTGLTTLYVPNKGFYTIAIDVFEYRNGVQISKTRRDIELIVIDCKPGPKPYKASSVGSTKKDTLFDYFLQEGDSIDIDVVYGGGDSIRLSASGELLGSTLSSKAIFTSSVGAKFVTGNLKWKVPCGYARSSAYQFNIYAINNNCPPKYVNNTYTVTVSKFKGAKTIIGPDTVCNSKTVTYNMGGFKARFKWKATGAKVVGIDTGQFVTFFFPDGINNAQITVYQENIAKCPGADTLTKNIVVVPSPASNSISGNINPCPNITEKYTRANSDANSLYFWFVSGGKIQSVSNSGSVNIIWDKGVTSGEVKMLTKSLAGCYGDTIRLSVVIGNPVKDTVEGPISVCPNSRGLDYWVKNPSFNSTYNWVVTGGTFVGNPKGSTAQVNWGNKGTGTITAQEVTKFGCLGDIMSLNVEKEYNLQTPPITGKTSLCEFTQNVIYQSKFSRGSTYSWKIVGGTINSGDGTYKISVNWDSAGQGLLQCIETAYDSINNQQCIGKPITLTVDLTPNPKTGPITGAGILCQYSISNYQVAGFSDSKYKWTVSGGNRILLPDTNSIIDIEWIKEGSQNIQVIETTVSGCVGKPIRKSVLINPVPKAKTISGPNKICLNDNKNKIYSVTNAPSSIFKWKIYGGNTNNYDSSSTLNANWLIPGIDSLEVIEVSGDGCNGPINKMMVYYDSFYSNIERVTTLQENDKIIQVDYQLKNTQFINKGIKLNRKEPIKSSFEFVDTVSIFNDSVLDKKALTSTFPYIYEISALNLCKNYVNSAPHKSILLEGKNPAGDSMILLNFNQYKGWVSGVKEYEVYFINQDTQKDSLITSNLDTFLSTIAPLEGNNLCFRIKAKKENLINNPDSNLVSYSNKVCFEFEPNIFIPNTFTPESNGLNDVFAPKVSNYKSFRMLIFNRWGEQIYETTSAKKGWNGKYRDVPCQEGVYLYLIYVEGNKENYFRKGTVNLLK